MKYRETDSDTDLQPSATRTEKRLVEEALRPRATLTNIERRPAAGRDYPEDIDVDITERVRAEESLRRSEERFRALVAASSEVLYTMSADWSQVFQLSGPHFAPDTEAPSGAWLERYIPTDDRPYVVAAINKAIRTKSIFELEHRVVRVDGSLGWTHSRAVPVLDRNGEIIEWFGSAKDITERVRAEETARLKETIMEAVSRTILTTSSMLS